MHSFLTNTPPKIRISPDVLEIHPDKSIGIEEIRAVTAFLARKPIQTAKNVVIIYEAHLLTLPAQNAFLKTLEEPTANSEIYLVTDYPDQLLPTVLSRVQTLSSDNKTDRSSMAYSQESFILFQKLLSSGVGERLKILDAAKLARDTALEFFNDCEKILHENITTGQLPTTNYQLLIDSKIYLKSNVNLKLILDNFALNLS